MLFSSSLRPDLSTTLTQILAPCLAISTSKSPPKARTCRRLANFQSFGSWKSRSNLTLCGERKLTPRQNKIDPINVLAAGGQFYFVEGSIFFRRRGSNYSDFSTYHHISSKARASAAKLIAELRSGIRVPLSTAVHTIAAQHTLSMMQVVDEEPLLARWNGEIHQNIIVRAIPLSLAIVSYLREILAIHLAIPFLGIDVILIQWLSVPVINGRHKRDANNQQHYDNQQYDIYISCSSFSCMFGL